MSGGLDNYDVRFPSQNYTDQISTMKEFLNDPDVAKDLHAEANSIVQKFVFETEEVVKDFLLDLPDSVLHLYQRVLDKDIGVLFYVGQFDSLLGSEYLQKALKKLKWKDIHNFYDSSRYVYYYKNDDNDKPTVGGNFKQFKNLGLMVVYNSGHLVPATQLALSRSMLADMLHNQTLHCHQPDGK